MLVTAVIVSDQAVKHEIVLSDAHIGTLDPLREIVPDDARRWTPLPPQGNRKDRRIAAAAMRRARRNAQRLK